MQKSVRSNFSNLLPLFFFPVLFYFVFHRVPVTFLWTRVDKSPKFYSVTDVDCGQALILQYLVALLSGAHHHIVFPRHTFFPLFMP